MDTGRGRIGKGQMGNCWASWGGPLPINHLQLQSVFLYVAALLKGHCSLSALALVTPLLTRGSLKSPCRPGSERHGAVESVSLEQAQAGLHISGTWKMVSEMGQA